MTKLRERVQCRRSDIFALKYWLVIVLTSVAVLLIVTSFVLPPLGVIDNSTLAATGELFAFAALAVFVIRAESGDDITFQKGDISVSVHSDEPHHEFDHESNRLLTDSCHDYTD